MPKFCANLAFMFREYALPDRFSAARKAGFKYIEYTFPYDHDPEFLVSLLKQNQLKQVLINLPPGNLEAGDLGLASDPDRIDEFRRSVDQALAYARTLGVSRINCLSGKRIIKTPYDEQRLVLVENLRFASSQLAAANCSLLVEPINTFDEPDFFVHTSADAIDLIEAVQAPNLFLQYDVYHMQKMEGNLTESLRTYLPRIGHIQISDNPGRHQPGTGEINYRFLLDELDRLRYRGFVGLEYFPTDDTLSSLEWIKDWGFVL
jgi:hydroxypyruvate isomerase